MLTFKNHNKTPSKGTLERKTMTQTNKDTSPLKHVQTFVQYTAERRGSRK